MMVSVTGSVPNATMKQPNDTWSPPVARRIMESRRNYYESLRPAREDWDWIGGTNRRILRTFLECGHLHRLKACSHPDYRWLFYDETKGNTRRWCYDRRCGNRDKVSSSPGQVSEACFRPLTFLEKPGNIQCLDQLIALACPFHNGRMRDYCCGLLAALVLLAGCSGKTLPTTAVMQRGGAAVTFVVTVPRGMSPHFVSPSTRSIVVALAGRKLLTIDVAAASPRCTTAKSRARVCAERTNAPSGTQIFDISAFDGPNGGGNVLASGKVEATLESGQDRPIRIALTGKPASLTLSLQNAYPLAGRATKTAVSVSALDADGNTIVGSYGTVIALRDSDTSGATKLSASSVSDSSGLVTLAYDGAPLLLANVSAHAAHLPAAFQPFAPSPTTVVQYAAPRVPTNVGPRSMEVWDLCVGPDGNAWATGAATGSIEKVDREGHYTTYPILWTGPVGISVGSDGNLWFAESRVGKIGRITTAGVVTSYEITTDKGSSSAPSWTTLGPDGRTWYVDEGAVGFGAIDATGAIVKFPLPKNSVPVEIVAGPDGNLWMTDGGLDAIVVASTAGKVLAVYKLPTANAGPSGITVGPDKNIWFAETVSNQIGRITIGGGIKEWSVPTSLGGPVNVASGPDGNVWFTESGEAFWDLGGKVGYITPDGSQIRDFPSPSLAHVHDLAFDSNGVLWYSEFNLGYSSVSKFIY